MLPPFPPKNYKISSAFSYNFRLALTAQTAQKPAQATPAAGAERKATGTAKGFDKSLSGTYTVTAGDGLHMRNVAGASDGSMVVLPYGTKVQNYGYYTQMGGVKWLYIQVTYKGVKYTGFSSGKYLKKQ